MINTNNRNLTSLSTLPNLQCSRKGKSSGRTLSNEKQASLNDFLNSINNYLAQ